MATVIIGAGIIGTSIAYYLSEQSSGVPPEDIHLIESCSELFASASGYAGGFLASDWFSPPSASLGALSYKLHKELAEHNDGAKHWGYHTTTTVSLAQASGSGGDDWMDTGRSRVEAAPSNEVTLNKGPSWLRQSRHRDIAPISTGDSTAQVDPLRLCQFLLSTCRSRGVQVHHPATPQSASLSPYGAPTSITLSTPSSSSPLTIPCTRIILAAGAWTPRVHSTLFPSSTKQIPVSSYAGHSLVFRVPQWKSGDEGSGAHAIYTTDENGYSPELFARAGGEIYIAGVNDAGIPLPDKPTDRRIDRASVEKLEGTARDLMVEERGVDGEKAVKEGLEVVREGLCFRPVTRNGTPILDKVQEGVWTAVGHGPWGISLSLGTGKVMSEMVLGKQLSADVSRLRL